MTQIEKNSIIPDYIISALREDFPRETHESKRSENGTFVQTGIKPAYVIERLNQILGMDGWDYVINAERETTSEAMAQVTMNLYIIKPIYEISQDEKGTNQTLIGVEKILIASRTHWGGNAISNMKCISDAKKGAITNAICKCASMFDVAHKAYKGLLPPVEEVTTVITDKEITQEEEKKKPGRRKLSKKETEEPISDEQFKKMKKELSDFFVERGLGREYLIKLAEDNFGKSQIKELTPQEFKYCLDTAKQQHGKATEPVEKDSDDNKTEDQPST